MDSNVSLRTLTGLFVVAMGLTLLVGIGWEDHLAGTLRDGHFISAAALLFGVILAILLFERGFDPVTAAFAALVVPTVMVGFMLFTFGPIVPHPPTGMYPLTRTDHLLTFWGAFVAVGLGVVAVLLLAERRLAPTGGRA